jgi:oligoribonuclease
VSSIGELCKRWFPKEFRNRPRKGNKHTALVDIKESVHELRYYKQHVFKKK